MQPFVTNNVQSQPQLKKKKDGFMSVRPSSANRGKPQLKLPI